MCNSGAQISDICNCASSGRLTTLLPRRPGGGKAGGYQSTRLAATLSWKSWRSGERHNSTRLPVVNVRRYVPLYLIMNGSGVSVLEIWVVILKGGRVGRRPIVFN